MCVLQEFVPVARELEKNWTRFSPHYIVWVCPWVYRQSDECKSQCIHNGRYCTPDPDGDLDNGYTGADVVQVSTNVTSLISCLVYFHHPFVGAFFGWYCTEVWLWHCPSSSCFAAKSLHQGDHVLVRHMLLACACNGGSMSCVEASAWTHKLLQLCVFRLAASAHGALPVSKSLSSLHECMESLSVSQDCILLVIGKYYNCFNS